MLTLREALPGDVERIEALERECFSLPWSREIIENQLISESTVMLTALSDGDFAGYMGMMFVPPEGYVTNVCTATNHRRSGVASALIDEMCRRGRALGLESLTLEVRESNAPARALYEGKGFQTLGKRPGYYERPREDAIIMTLYFH